MYVFKISAGIIDINFKKIHWEKSLVCYKDSQRHTSHSAYVATSTESDGAKIDGFL